MKHIYIYICMKAQRTRRTVCANSVVSEHAVLSQSPSETRAVTSDFWVIMPSVDDDDVAGLLLTRHILYI